jgi:ankyrin repeat protein
LVKENKIKQVRSQLAKGISPDVGCDKNRTPLLISANMGNPQIAKLLLRYKAKPDIADSTGETALMAACSGPILEPPKQGPGLQKQKEKIRSIKLGKASICTLLVAARCDVNLRDSSGITALCHAVIFGYSNTCDLLLSHSADINIATHNGMTALHFAAQAGNTKIITSLLAHGADPLMKDNKGNIPFDLVPQEKKKEFRPLLLLEKEPR